MAKIAAIILGLVLFGFILGYNSGLGTHKNLWDPDREGLKNLNSQMGTDESQRLGILIITENSCYGLSAIQNNIAMFGGFANRETREIHRQCWMDFWPYKE